MAFDKGKPEPGIKAKLLDDRIRTNNEALEDAISHDHDFTTAGTQTGKHMVITMQEQASPGASASNEGNLAAVDSGTQPELEFTSEDGNAITLTSNGSIGSNSSNMMVNDVSIGGKLDVTGTTGIDGNLDVNTDKFTVDATTGNTSIAGDVTISTTLSVTGIATLGDGSILAAATESGDTDRTISDKAFVDNSVNGDVPTTEDSESSPLEKTNEYLSQTSGYVNAFVTSGAGNQLKGFIGSALVATNGGSSGDSTNIFMFVPTNKTFKVTVTTDTPTITWTPLVSGGAPPVNQS